MEPLEKAALEHIRKQAADRERPAGAILFEPIPAASGVRFYRKEFVEKLQSLAEELHLPIVADEVYTSGGLTGTFFAYEQYPGFKPDYVLFGKGLQTGGIARVRRPSDFNGFRLDFPFEVGVTTVNGDQNRFLKGAAVLQAIRERDLMSNVNANTSHVLERLRGVQAILKDIYPEKKIDARGIGYLVSGDLLLEGEFLVGQPIPGERGRVRFTLALTETRESIDAALDAYEKFLIDLRERSRRAKAERAAGETAAH